MTVMAIVQARSSSTRFPRKVLQDLHGQPMVVRQLERISRCQRVDRIVVATSEDASDDELTTVLAENGVEVRRGPLADVFTRFHGIVDEFSPAHVVRLTADCPLTDPSVIDELIELHLAANADYSSNALERTYPHGLDAECVKSAVFDQLSKLELTPLEREHVTQGIYTRPEMFTIASMTQSIDLSHLRWTVDYPADFAFVQKVYSYLYDEDPGFGQNDILELLEKRSELVHTEANI